MNTKELNELAQRVHKLNEKWWQHPVTKERIERNKGELLMLVITELAEACEGERKNLMDDKLPHRKMAEVECADAVIRMLDFAAGFVYHLQYEDVPYEYVLNSIPDNKGEALLSISYVVCKAFISEEKLGFAIQMVDDYCKKHSYDLWGALEEKLQYNSTRADHTHEARLQADGKKW